MRQLIWILLGFMSIAACKCRNENAASNAVKLPNTPLEVVAKWQEFQDSKQFDLARQLSTDRAKKFIDKYDKLMNDPEMSDATVPKTIFQNLDCRLKNDSCAVCSFFTEEDGEKLNDSLHLFKRSGQWLVDLPDDEVGNDLNDSMPEDLLFPSDSIDQ
jgi:hypothetical protein